MSVFEADGLSREPRNSDECAEMGGDERDAPAPASAPDFTEHEVNVELQRSVRVGRVVVGGAMLGAVLASGAAMCFQLPADADYTLAQVAGFAAICGAAIGLVLGGVCVLLLGAAARRRLGSGVAVQRNVR